MHINRFFAILAALCAISIVGCARPYPSGGVNAPTPAQTAPEALTFDHAMELTYAKSFSVDFYKGGCALITISGGEKLFLVPESREVPADAPADAVILKQPLARVLISTTPTMSLISALGALDAVSMTTTDVDGWYIPSVADAMNAGRIVFIGNYKEPDYEKIIAEKPDLAIFSTMLDSAPEVSEKLTELGVPYMRDHSTFEDHPLARTEWVKLYGLLFGREQEAQAIFDTQVKVVKDSIAKEGSGKTAVIFYITSKGEIVTRQSGDYIAKMLELAGGRYVFEQVSSGETGTLKMEPEQFYAGAKDADYIIYIHNLGGRPETIADLVELNEMLADFKAVQDGNVWCTTPNFFQISDTMGNMIADMREMFTTTDDTLTYLFKLS